MGTGFERADTVGSIGDGGKSIKARLCPRRVCKDGFARKKPYKDFHFDGIFISGDCAALIGSTGLVIYSDSLGDDNFAI